MFNDSPTSIMFDGFLYTGLIAYGVWALASIVWLSALLLVLGVVGTFACAITSVIVNKG